MADIHSFLNTSSPTTTEKERIGFLKALAMKFKHKNLNEGIATLGDGKYYIYWL